MVGIADFVKNIKINVNMRVFYQIKVERGNNYGLWFTY